VTTLIARRSRFHQVHLVARLAAGNPVFGASLAEVTHVLADAGLGAWEAQWQAYARFYEMVLAQAQVLAGAMFVLGFVLDRNGPRAAGSVSVHRRLLPLDDAGFGREDTRSAVGEWVSSSRLRRALEEEEE